MRIAWISHYPIEYMPGLPGPLRGLPRLHPATWKAVLLQQLKGLPDVQLEVIVVRKHFPTSMAFESDGVRFHCLKLPGGMRSLSLFWWETLQIRRCLRKLRPDLVHAWGTERGAALVASRLRYPYLVTMQGLLNWYLEHVDLGPHMKLDAWLETVSIRRASVVSVESNFGVQWLKEHHPHLEIHQVEHAPSPLFHQVVRQPQLQPLRFLTIGIASMRKGTDLVLRALDRLIPELDFRLTLAGSEEKGFFEKMRRETSAALWARVTCQPHLSPDQIAQELAQTTMVLFPTRVDNSPNAVKEAVAAGVPVVASGVGGILDYVIPGKNGFVFPPGDLEQFILSIRRAVSHPQLGRGCVDPQTLKEMQLYLSPKRMGEGFLACYRRVKDAAAFAR